jgi:uncharacterized membrane protein
MELARFARHFAMTPWKARRAFPDAVMDAIQQAVAQSELLHRGEVRFVVEPELTTGQLWAAMSARARAVEVFSMLQVWNTDENTGVLVYVLLADHQVEIVADRGIQKQVAAGDWDAVVQAMQAHFREERYAEGALAGVKGVSEILARHFPADGRAGNELPDRPIIL